MKNKAYRLVFLVEFCSFLVLLCNGSAFRFARKSSSIN